MEVKCRLWIKYGQNIGCEDRLFEENCESFPIGTHNESITLVYDAVVSSGWAIRTENYK